MSSGVLSGLPKEGTSDAEIFDFKVGVEDSDEPDDPAEGAIRTFELLVLDPDSAGPQPTGDFDDDDADITESCAAHTHGGCKGKVTIKRRGKKATVLGSGSFSIQAGHQGKVVLVLTKQGRQLLAGKKQEIVKVVTAIKVNGKTHTTQLAVELKAQGRMIRLDRRRPARADGGGARR